MVILFSPSEKKLLHHKDEIQGKYDFVENLISDTKFLKDLLSRYCSFLKEGKESDISKMLGVKSINLDELVVLQNILSSPLLKAVLRYDGVAFKALDYKSLNQDAMKYIDNHVFIFSNLFGILRAYDLIPFYDLKQNEGFIFKNYSFKSKDIYDINKDKYYDILRDSNREILDLRAGFYQKCFPLNKEFTIYEPVFVKNGKTISHYSKHYRGMMLRECARLNIKSVSNIESIKFDDLELIDICKKADKFYITYNLL